MKQISQDPKIEETEEGVIYCDGLMCNMFFDSRVRCSFCPVKV